MLFALVAKRTKSLKVMIYNPVNKLHQTNFFSICFLKKYRKSTAVLLIWKYRYRGTNLSKVTSTGTAVLLQSTVPTYGQVA